MMQRETFHRLLQILTTFFLLLLGVYATMRGLELRREMFEWSDPIHHGDYVSGFYRGRIVHQNGIFDTYDKIAQHAINGEREGIDYAPLRLTAVALWAKWFEETQPRPPWRGTYDDTRPMLMANTAAEWSSSVLVFLIVRLWWVRSHASSDWRGTIASVIGFVGAILLWFNPATLWDSHCWPQWDVWLLPFFLGALFLACTDWWFAAGACVMVGAFLKGQILLVAPIFVLWPLFQLRWWQALMGVCGAVTMTAMLAAPWMLRPWFSGEQAHWPAKICFASIVLLFLTMPLVDRYIFPMKRWWRVQLAGGAGALIVAYFTKSNVSLYAASTALTTAAMLTTIIPWRRRLPITACLVAVTALLLMHFGEASTAWFTIGFEYGTQKFTGLASAPGTYSLPAILGLVFGWRDDMNLLVSPIPGYLDDIPLSTLTRSIYAVCLVLCAAGAAVNDRRRDSRFLIAFVAPWVCFFSLLPQMNNRYMIWGAVLPALLVGTDVGLTLLGILLSGLAVAGMCYHMMGPRSDFAPDISQYVYQMRNNPGWCVALIGAIYLYSAVVPRRRAKEIKVDLATDGAPIANTLL